MQLPSFPVETLVIGRSHAILTFLEPIASSVVCTSCVHAMISKLAAFAHIPDATLNRDLSGVDGYVRRDVFGWESSRWD